MELMRIDEIQQNFWWWYIVIRSKPEYYAEKEYCRNG